MNLQITIESEIYSCDITLPEEKSFKFLDAIHRDLRKRIKKINAACELKTKTKDVIANIVALKHGLKVLRANELSDDINAAVLQGAIPLETVKLGYESFKDSIEWTEGRGAASGHTGKRINKDGNVSNITVGALVQSGNVGYMDSSAMIRYCRKTAFAKKYFETFKAGIPFVQAIDKLYAELCPLHYAKQIAIAKATNINYRIADTSFTTVTVNRNFQTAVHKDSGDYQEGFGNLIVYREGNNWSGSYFCLPEYRVAIDMQNTDVLFVDVHRWHGNTPFINHDPDKGDLRIAFVLYYREYMYQCKSPKEELERVKIDQGGFLRL